MRETAFMALFGRKDLPHRSSLSRFLADVDRPCLEAFRALFEQQTFAEGWTSETIGGIFDRQGRRSIVFDVDATRQAARQRGLPCDPALPAARRRRGCRMSHPAIQDASEGRWFAHAPQRGPLHTRQWVGTYAGKGNGDYRGELGSALRSITAYLKHFAFPPEMALVRLDGADARCDRHRSASAGGHIFRDAMEGISTLGASPDESRVLAHPPTASMTRRNSGEVVELFDGGWLEPRRGLVSRARDCDPASRSSPRQEHSSGQACR